MNFTAYSPYRLLGISFRVDSFHPYMVFFCSFVLFHGNMAGAKQGMFHVGFMNKINRSGFYR